MRHAGAEVRAELRPHRGTDRAGGRAARRASSLAAVVHSVTRAPGNARARASAARSVDAAGAAAPSAPSRGIRRVLACPGIGARANTAMSTVGSAGIAICRGKARGIGAEEVGQPQAPHQQHRPDDAVPFPAPAGGDGARAYGDRAARSGARGARTRCPPSAAAPESRPPSRTARAWRTGTGRRCRCRSSRERRFIIAATSAQRRRAAFDAHIEAAPRRRPRGAGGADQLVGVVAAGACRHAGRAARRSSGRPSA